MTCIKTGAMVYIECYDKYVYGDAHEVNGVLIFRVCEELETVPSFKHIDIGNFEYWFGKGQTTQTNNSTLVTSDYKLPFGVDNFGCPNGGGTS